ncbi:hypothetical protein C6P44_001155, partial [Monosporozyma unispora]
MDFDEKQDYVKELSYLESNQTNDPKDEKKEKVNETGETPPEKTSEDAAVLGWIVAGILFLLIFFIFLFGRGSKTILECPVEFKTVDFIEGNEKVEYFQVMRQIIEKDKKCGFDYSSEEFQKFNQSIYNTFQLDVDGRIVNKYFPFQNDEQEDKNS